MWQHHYLPLAGLPLSALAAAAPVFVLIVMLAILRKPAWMAASVGLGAAVVTALLVYHMPVVPLVAAAAYGAAFGLFPIGWIVFNAILLYNITIATGQFSILKASIGSLTQDRRLQALLIAFAFGAFLEGAAGFGTPVAVAAAMLTGLGFTPFYAAAICLLANTAPVAFGSIGIPLATLAAITSLPLARLSAGVGRICAPVSLFIPSYLVLVMGGWRALRGVLPAAAVCGIVFAGTQFAVSNFIGPELTDILASLASLVALVILFKIWRPSDAFRMADENPVAIVHEPYTTRQALLAWAPYGLLVFFVLLWGYQPAQRVLQKATLVIQWPGLHNRIQRVPPVTSRPAPYAALYTLNWLAASGTACLFAALASAALLRMRPRALLAVIAATFVQLRKAELTLACMLALAFLLNYSGATATLGLAFAATGPAFPFFSALLGWLGVFLTGSDTSANALFGYLQVVSANRLGMNPVLMAASNSSGGVMGKMISLTSVAVASAASGMRGREESKLFQFTLGHSVLLASIIGALVTAYVYLWPQVAP